jgi:hypothetical protein
LHVAVGLLLLLFDVFSAGKLEADVQLLPWLILAQVNKANDAAMRYLWQLQQQQQQCQWQQQQRQASATSITSSVIYTSSMMTGTPPAAVSIDKAGQGALPGNLKVNLYHKIFVEHIVQRSPCTAAQHPTSCPAKALQHNLVTLEAVVCIPHCNSSALTRMFHSLTVFRVQTLAGNLPAMYRQATNVY